MVNGISSTGSIKDLPVYQQYYQMYLAYNKDNKSNITFESWLQRNGYREHFLQQIENYLETGDVNKGDGVNGNTLNVGKVLTNGNYSMYQSQDEETYYDFDFDNGTYKVYSSNEDVAAVLGINDTQTIDTISFGYNSANVTNYTFGNLDNGQDSTTTISQTGKYANVSYVEQEFDIDYLMNALLMNPNDPQYQTAVAIFDELIATMHQWCSTTELEELDAIAAEHGTNSTEYKDKLKEIILKNLDQVNEWIEGHEHVEYKNEDTMNISPDEFEEVEGEIPEYDMIEVLAASGLLVDYSNNTERAKESTDTRQIARDRLQAQFQQDLSAIVAALQAQLGDQLTDEIQSYINKAVQVVSENEVVIKTSCHNHGFLGMHDKYRAKYTVKELADIFLKTFNSLCKNKGKTDEEVEAAKKIQTENKANRNDDYKEMYNTDISAIASEAGVSDSTVVPTGNNQYAEIQAKAESSIIEPLKEKLMDKFKGKSIPDKDLEELLDAAGDAALANPQYWATTDNNYTYTINSDELVSIFEDYLKKGITNKGYDFANQV